MQLFRLSIDPRESVAAYPDRYTYNQIREGGQFLRYALQLNDDSFDFTKPNNPHLNHPITQWASESRQNWLDAYCHLLCCQSEWRQRYNHPTTKVHGSLVDLPYPDCIPASGLTLQPCAFSDKYKPHPVPTSWDEVVANYRNYIIEVKSRKSWFKYERADSPQWL